MRSKDPRQTFDHDTWIKRLRESVNHSKEPFVVPYGHDAFSTFQHDPVSGHGLLLDYKANAIWAYDPDKTAWTKLKPEGDPMPKSGTRLAYFDPLRKVFTVVDGVKVWAYRYQ